MGSDDGAESGALRGLGVPRAPELPGVDLGPLRNGLGALENLALLLRSIKVGQKSLFAAVAAVHADCAPMIASVVAAREELALAGIDVGCARRLCDALAANLRDLEGTLAHTVGSGRLSVSERLKLEVEIPRAARELGATLPLVALLDRASRAKRLEPTPAELIHDGDSEEADAVVVHVTGTEAAHGITLHVDLEAAKLIVAVGVSLVVHGQVKPTAKLSFSVPRGGKAVTTIERGPGDGIEARILAPRMAEPTLLCAQVALTRLGGRLEYSAAEHRVSIDWPLSGAEGTG